MRKLFFFAVIAIAFVSCKKELSGTKQPDLVVTFKSITWDKESQGQLAHFQFKADVKAVDGDFTISSAATFGEIAHQNTSIAFVIENMRGVIDAGNSVSYATTSTLQALDHTYSLPEAHTMDLTFDVYFISPGPGAYRMRVSQLQGVTTNGTTVTVKFDPEKYHTDYLQLQ